MTLGTTTLRGFTYPNVVIDFLRGLEQHRGFSVQLLGPIGLTVSGKAQLTGKTKPGAPALTASVGGGYEYINSRALLHGGLVQSWHAPSGRLRHLAVYHTENGFEPGTRGILVQPSLTFRGTPRARRRR